MANYRLAEELDEQKCKLKDINDFLVNELKARALSYAVLQSDLAEATKGREASEALLEVCGTDLLACAGCKRVYAASDTSGSLLAAIKTSDIYDAMPVVLLLCDRVAPDKRKAVPPHCERCAASHPSLRAQSEMARVRAEDDAVIEELRDRVLDAERKARSAEEYLGKREALLGELAALKAALADARAGGARAVSELERQHVQDRCAALRCVSLRCLRICTRCVSARACTTRAPCHWLRVASDGARSAPQQLQQFQTKVKMYEWQAIGEMQGQVEADDEQAHSRNQGVHDEADRQPARTDDKARDHGERADERRAGVPVPADQRGRAAEPGARSHTDELSMTPQ